MGKTIEIIIPTFNQKDDLMTCLRLLNDSIADRSNIVNVTVIDDHSSKEVREDIITNICKFNVFKNMNVSPIFMSKQCGFIKCCNVGLSYVLGKKKKPDYIGFMHDDTKVVVKDWLFKLTDEFDKDLMAWAACAYSSCDYDINSVKSLGIKEIPEDKPHTEEELKLYIDAYISKVEPKDTDKTEFFGVLFRREAFEEFGYFSENVISQLGMEYEFCDRLKANGKLMKAVPAACVMHKSRKMSPIENPDTAAIELEKAAVALNKRIIESSNGTLKKYVVYFFRKWDEEFPVLEYDPKVDYVCFAESDNKKVPHPWISFDIKPFAAYLGIEAGSKEMKEFIKMHPQMFFKNYSVSLYFDKMKVDSPRELVAKIQKDDFLMTLDSQCDCAYKYLVELKSSKYIDDAAFDAALQMLKWCKYPANNGLCDTSFMLRKHNDQRCIDAMNKTWNFMKKTILDSDLFLNFSLWLLKQNMKCLPSALAKKTILKDEKC